MDISVSEINEHMRITGAYEDAYNNLKQRKITAQAAVDRGIKIADEDLQNAVDVYRVALGLNSAQETQQWLDTKEISAESVENFVEINLLIKAFKNQLEQEADIQKHLDSPQIKEAVKNLIYEEWLCEVIK